MNLLTLKNVRLFFSQIDKLEKEVLEKYEKALSEVLPTAFSIVKDTARRLSENEELEVTASDFDRELAAQDVTLFVLKVTRYLEESLECGWKRNDLEHGTLRCAVVWWRGIASR